MWKCDSCGATTPEWCSCRMAAPASVTLNPVVAETIRRESERVTLRDQFAMAALPVVMETIRATTRTPSETGIAARAAIDAYAVADAMLKVRAL